MIETMLIVLTFLVVVNIIIHFVRKPHIGLTKIDLANELKDITTSMQKFDYTLERMEKSINDDFQRNREEANAIAKSNRDELAKSLKTFSDKFSEDVNGFNNLLRQNFGDFSKQQTELNSQTKENLNEVKHSVEKHLKEIREDNTKKLEEIRTAVDEKLQKTLNERLSQSFENVGKQLISVQEGLGEMKNLAADVGGLKKVLSNVKMRGGIGEVQLEMLLEQILAPEQYGKNVATKRGSASQVEFAIKLPGRDDEGSVVWLPIDAKFPKDTYEQLVDAYEVGDQDAILSAKKNMENAIKKMAKDIGDKYIDPPNTTDFGIMFLPFEGIYAEVVRDSSLLELLQRDYKITVTGPATLAAILNSLQMGFKTLAIEKRSSEVWKILGAVKKEFENFEGLMSKAHKNIQTGLDQLDDVMGKRTRAIQRKLKNVEASDYSEVKKLLPEIADPTVSIEDMETDET